MKKEVVLLGNLGKQKNTHWDNSSTSEYFKSKQSFSISLFLALLGKFGKYMKYLKKQQYFRGISKKNQATVNKDLGTGYLKK